MKNRIFLGTVLGLFLTTALQAQDISWDKDKYPDYSPTPTVNKTEVQSFVKRIRRQNEQGKKRPDHWNNALSNAFPPVMNQSAGSCGSASRIYYMFAHEINAARWADGSLAENIYPTHFTWLLTWTPNGQGKEVIAQHNGIPNSEVYGGYTYSDLFGYQDCDTKDSDYGWMQGYNKWFHAMHNRISGSANFSIALDKEEGRELVKNYLWNHCGDETFSTGGIVGVGVASGGNWQKIPKTTTNDQLGVTGKYYVKNWGSSVDHALTIVGYDDRIEFDLDGNGVKGEADKDEIGAWIIVNSWGSSWNNGGFVYCPYAEARPTNNTTGYWTPEYYTIRRNYKPLRTLKVKMDYSHRSEIALYVGYSTNLRATKPDKELWLRHFYYSGLGKGVTVSSSNPDPQIPMLGRWADGVLHTEPMEFGYDLTDLVADVDPATPLKYFFRVETRSWAKGEGHIYKASIMDYAIDPEGIETPFKIPEDGQLIKNKGQKTTITATARGENLPAPRNLSIADQTLTWQAPVGNQYEVEKYNIYFNGELLSSIDGSTLQASAKEAGSYCVTAVYTINGNQCESAKSSSAFKSSTNEANTYLQLAEGAQITIPNFNQANANQFTIEFWLRPDQLSTTSDNFGMKSSSGKFFFKVNKQKRIEAGFDGGDYGTSTRALSTGTWQHVAIIADNGKLNVYVGSSQFLNFSSSWSNTVGSVGNLTLGQSEGTTANYKELVNAPWTGSIDELRIWSGTRSATNITSMMNETYVFPSLTSGLTCYYKMNTRQEGSNLYLVDAIAGKNATISNPEDVTTRQETGAEGDIPFSAKASTDFTLPTSASLFKAVNPITNCAPGTTEWAWTFTGADITSSAAPNPVVVFKETGQQTVKLVTKNLNGETTEKEKTITINAVEAPQADFTVSMSEIAAGEHVSFINTSTPLDDCTFEWTMIGAETEISRTINAAATYPATGTYTVRLTATNSAGSDTVEKKIEIVKVAPESAFTIHNNVAIVGEDIRLEDQTKYEPDSWQWTINSMQHTYIVRGQNSTIKIDNPGVYSVALHTSNEKGESTTTRAKAIVVCNADGETGLKFDDLDDEVVIASPFSEESVKTFTIDFWLYAGTLKEKCIGIGDSEATFLLTTGLDGAMTITVNNKTQTSISGLVVANEWHHYAITYSNGTVNFYRDAVPYGDSKKITGVTTTPAWSQLRLGGTDAPMNAIIDELRVWNKALTYAQIKSYANAPISEPAANTNLVLYYDFNQSSGDVADHSTSNLIGKRNNFGPDGDSWTSSKGIFFLNFEEAQDVTSKYLKNYKAPFYTASGTVNSSNNSRFKKLQTGVTRSPWVQENSVAGDGVTTEFHVDGNKENYLTLSTTWDGFANQVQNLKLYQTVELPAGAYEFYALQGSWEWKPITTKTVVAAGTGLPDWNDLDTQAIASSYSGLACKFTLLEPTTVSIGLVSNQSGTSCHAINKFVLTSSGFTLIDAIDDPVINDADYEYTATGTLQAIGGLGVIRIFVEEPQDVDIFDLSGKCIWSGFITQQATIPARKGLYTVKTQKVLVR